MWKNTEQEEYEASAPAVKAHFHALRAEEAWKREEYVQVEREARLASEKFIEAANAIHDKRTIDALMLLAENYEYRAHAAHAKLPEHDDGKTKGEARINDKTANTTTDKMTMNGKKTTMTMAVGGREPVMAQGFTPMSTGLESLDPTENAHAAGQLNQAAEEIEELWRRLHELGLSGGHADKNHVLMSSRHLSSSLGDSFCLLPTKARTPIGAQAVAIDGGSTLRAAVASRMRNQRVRLMEKQYGPRAAVDTRLQPQLKQHGANPKDSLHSFKDASRPSITDPHHAERRSSLSGRGSDVHDPDSMQETISHQKYEIVRLLNTVKTLSNENTTLLKKCDALSQVQEENRELQESMDKFKTLYNQKLVRIKRALEEWRRQQDQNQRGGSNGSTPAQTASSHVDPQIQQQQLQIQQLTASLAKRETQLAKYEQWYQTLKAGARAKRSQNEAGGMDGSGMNGGTMPRDSFTNSNSLHELNGSSNSQDTMNGGTRGNSMSHSLSRPPAHPTRRAL